MLTENCRAALEEADGFAGAGIKRHEQSGSAARAACYYALCLKLGGWPDGTTILPELIKRERDEYSVALQTAHVSFANTGEPDLGHLHAIVVDCFRCSSLRLALRQPPTATRPRPMSRLSQHKRALGLLGPDTNPNCAPAHEDCRREKDRQDVGMMAKAKRQADAGSKADQPAFAKPAHVTYDWRQRTYIKTEQAQS